MGNGIAQTLAVAGHPVIMTDVAQGALDRALKTIDASLDRLVKREKMSAEAKAQALSLIQASTDLASLGGVDLVVEAATENLALKLDLFARLDGILKDEAIIASNTSSISITRLAAATGRPGQVIGMHFFNPVPVMQLVELIRGLQTDDATHATALEFAKVVGKSPVTARNSPTGVRVDRNHAMAD
jgi:3-hydroxybutyryl-CoA dehydrogenase